MKIAVIAPIFSIAGVPLAQLRLARSLAYHGYEVDFIIGHIAKGYNLPNIEKINKVVITKSKNVRSMLFPLMKYFLQNKPSIIFSAEDHLNIIVIVAAILTFSKVKISGSSRVTPFDTYSKHIFSKGWILKQLMNIVMWRANALTCVSKDMIKQYVKVFKNPPHVYAYNIIDDYHSRLKIQEHVNHEWLNTKKTPIIISAGRLAPWKGFEYLINSIKLIEEKNNARLIILGDGELRNKLELLVKNLNLSKRIVFLGYVENSLKYFKKADVFALSSVVEGLPNVLVEAMMCGCTPVATDCPTGPREVLMDGKYGYLVEMRNSESLANGLLKALNKPISNQSLNQAIKPFKDTEVINHHLKILDFNDINDK